LEPVLVVPVCVVELVVLPAALGVFSSPWFGLLGFGVAVVGVCDCTPGLPVGFCEAVAVLPVVPVDVSGFVAGVVCAKASAPATSVVASVSVNVFMSGLLLGLLN